jgi:hypothetical protein
MFHRSLTTVREALPPREDGASEGRITLARTRPPALHDERKRERAARADETAATASGMKATMREEQRERQQRDDTRGRWARSLPAEKLPPTADIAERNRPTQHAGRQRDAAPAQGQWHRAFAPQAESSRDRGHKRSRADRHETRPSARGHDWLSRAPRHPPPAPRSKAEPRPRRKLIARGALRGTAPADRKAAYKRARVACLLEAIPDGAVLLTLGKGDPQRALDQVPDAHKRRRLFEATLTAKGGKRGEGLDPIWRAVELMSAAARANGDAGPLGLPLSAARVGELLLEEKAMSDAAVRSLHDAFVWMQTHLRWPIDMDKHVTGAIADFASGRSEQARKKPKKRAGTQPLAYKMQLEFLARNGPTCFVRHLARSRLIFGIDNSIRAEDAEDAETRRDSDPSVVRGFAPLSKDGEPMELFTVARGFLGAYTWLNEWLDDVARLGNRPFPAFKAKRGSAGSVRGAIFWVPGSLDKDQIHYQTMQMAAMPPLELPLDVWGREGSLGTTKHSDHGSANDWSKSMGFMPQDLPYATALAERPPRGFTRDEGRALGHWLRDKDADEDGGPTRWSRTDQTTRPDKSAGAPRNAEMVSVYSMGETRSGDRDEQLRLRGRMADYGHAATNLWTGHWSCPWWRLPQGRDDRYILTKPPATLAPAPSRAPAHVTLRWTGARAPMTPT